MTNLIRKLRGVFSAGHWLPVLRRLPGRSDAVGLSFDDGPTPETTRAVIELLRHFGATASFFLLGTRAAREPQLVAELVAAGHDVFAHGWDHIHFDQLPISALVRDLTRTEKLLRRYRPTPSTYLVRLPYGAGRREARLHRAIRGWCADAQIAHWRYSFDDHRLAIGCKTELELARACVTAVDRVFAHADLPGAILLLHEQAIGNTASLNARVAPILLEIVLQRLRQQGLRGCKVVPAPVQPFVRRFIQM